MYNPYPVPKYKNYEEFVEHKKSILKNKGSILTASTEDACRQKGIQLSNISWEDVQRFENSCYGPNISDCTLSTSTGVDLPIAKMGSNFQDVVSIMDSKKIFLIVGNYENGEKRAIRLCTYLKNIGAFEPSLQNPTLSLYDTVNDSKITVRYQVVLVPNNSVEVIPTVFNYQTKSSKSPKNLMALSCHLGTTAHLNTPGKQWLDMRRFGENGIVKTAIKVSLSPSPPGGLTTENAPKKTVCGVKEMGLSNNTFLFVQIPLEQKRSLISDASLTGPVYRSISSAYVDEGRELGSFGGHDKTAIDGIRRDITQPITVTVSTYIIVDTLDSADIDEIYTTLTKRYEIGDWIGSIVTQTGTSAKKEFEECPLSAPPVDSEYIKSIMRMSSASDIYPDSDGDW